MVLPFKAHRSLYFLLLFSLLVRGLVATFLELGNDEVYYWTFAKYPAMSHFDHPPMVGYVMQLFSLNLFFEHAFFLRLPSIVFGTISTYLVYLIGLLIANQNVAKYAAFLYTASIYCTVISGVFIMPDSPLVPLWLMSLFLLLQLTMDTKITRKSKTRLLYAGICIGLAMLSKYHAAFLWFGFLTYVLFYERRWLRCKELYLALAFTALCVLPILWWNWQHDFISFRFQGERVRFFDQPLRLDYFATELIGQFLYNNPFNFVLTVMAIIAILKGKNLLPKATQQLLLLTALPLIATILFFSFFRKTLPHWSGPAYLTLLFPAAALVGYHKKQAYYKMVSGAVSLLFFVLILGTVEINHGFLTTTFGKSSSSLHQMGKHDVTLDMYGWRQFRKTFSGIVQRDRENGEMNTTSPIIAHRWFTAAHLDLYVAQPLEKKLLAFGDLKAIHKYAWINASRGLPAAKENAYYITHSRAYKPVEVVAPYFEEVIATDTVPIYRAGEITSYFFVYHLKDYQSNFINPLAEVNTP